MTSISESKENTTMQAYVSPAVQNNRTNGKLYFHNGSYQMVFVDASNGNREYILDRKGTKLYLDELAILKFQDENNAMHERLLSGYEEQEKQHKTQKEKWHEKFVAENEKYDFFLAAKQAAQKSYRKILSMTGCSDLSDLKSFDKANGSSYLKQAKTFLEEKHNAHLKQIGTEFMSAFYGRMYVDEAQNITEIGYQKAIANSIFAST